jgi:hypothetical protein
LSSQMQVKLPVRLARELRLQAGDEFYWRHSDDDPAVLLLVPSEVVERRYSAGERLEAAGRPGSRELDPPEMPPTDDKPAGHSGASG